MGKSEKTAKGAAALFTNKKPKGGSSSTGKGKQQDIELGGETKPAAGARSSGGSRAVPLDKQISALLNKNGDLKDKSPEAVQKITKIIARWEVNETTSLSDLGGKGIQSSVLKYLKKSGNQEMYVSALAKHDPSSGKMPTREFHEDYNNFVQPSQPRQERAPLESTGKSPTSRPDNRTGRGGKNSDTVSTQERVSEATARILDGNGTDEDFDFVLKQGLGWNDKKQTGAFLDEFQAAASTQDVKQRSKIIERMAQNAAAVGNHSKQSQPFLQRRFREYIRSQVPLYKGAKTSGGGVKIGDGPLPTEKQQPLNFDGGGDARTAGPAIPVDEPEDMYVGPDNVWLGDNRNSGKRQLELTETKVDKTPKPPDGNQAADGTPAGRASNANKTQNTTEGPGQVPPEGAKRQPSEGGLGGNELPTLKDWARSHLLNTYINKTGRDPTVDPKAAREFEAGFQKAWRQIMEQPDPIATLKQMQAKNATTSQPTPEPTVNPAAAGTASSRANAAAGGSNVPPKNPSIPPGGATPKPGRGGLAPTGQTPSASKLNQNLKNAPKVMKATTNRSGTITGTALATGLVGSLAWNWLTGGSSREEDGQVSTPSASITGGPSTSTGSSSGSVADGSGGSSGGMSQEQMEYMMKLQQIRDEQKRRHVGFGNTHSGVSR